MQNICMDDPTSTLTENPHNKQYRDRRMAKWPNMQTMQLSTWNIGASMQELHIHLRDMESAE
jgi:hypothetical protein